MNKFEEDKEILEDPEAEKYDMEINKSEDFHYWPDEKLKKEIENMERKIDQAVANFPRDIDEDGPEAGAVEEMLRQKDLLKSELQSREEWRN